MVLWVFDGNMVGKWTNGTCNGVDEVVNPFWVLTRMMPNMLKDAIVSKEWVDLRHLIKCLYNPKL